MKRIVKFVNKYKFLFILFFLVSFMIISIYIFSFIKEKDSFVDNKTQEIIDEQSPYFTVEFDTNGGNNIESIVVKQNEKIEEPSKPFKANYEFVEWQLNGQKYDFSAPVKENIILVAKWKEKTTNNSSNNTTTNNQSLNTNNSSTKINLNNNINITEYHIDSGSFDCFYYMFPQNLLEVFPDAKLNSSTTNATAVNFWPNMDRQDYEISTEEIEIYLKSGQLKINSTNENNFKNVLNKYKNGNYTGITNVEYQEKNHRFTYKYEYISFNGLNVSSKGEEANKEIEQALKKATKFMGPCGSYDNYENKILDEDLCTKYNLNCGRW